MFDIWVGYASRNSCFLIRQEGLLAAQEIWDMMHGAGFRMISARP